MTDQTPAQIIAGVAKAVGHVSKTGRNTAQGFNFRGIDAVLNAVGPHLSAAGVTIALEGLDLDYSEVRVGAKQTPMAAVRARCSYVWHTPAGPLVTLTAAEAMDSGDKATAKVLSVALRTNILQTLCLPTDEPDPDTFSYERSEAQPTPAPQQAQQAGTDWVGLAGMAGSVDDIRRLWQQCSSAGQMTEAVDAAMRAAADRVSGVGA